MLIWFVVGLEFLLRTCCNFIEIMSFKSRRDVRIKVSFYGLFILGSFNLWCIVFFVFIVFVKEGW